MDPEPIVRTLARFATAADLSALSAAARDALKLRLLDGLACALGARGEAPVAMLRRYVDEMGGNPTCSLIGGGRTSPDRAALYNGYLVRHLDFNDSYLALGETCHPSDNIAPVLAAAEHAGADGETLLAALAVAYQVQCRLSDEAPVRSRGFDHTVQGSYAAACGVARALGLCEERAASAIAIAGTAFNALRVTRTGALSHWKGLAYPNTAFCAVHAAFLARQGITGPPEVFEGNKGFMDSIAGRFDIDWNREGFERVCRTIVKKYNAEIHSQSVLEALDELRREQGLTGASIAAVEIEIFDVAYHIIGGGEEGDKRSIQTKEQADHSLPYMAAVMLLDGEVTPRQYAPERIRAPDVQALLRRVQVVPGNELSARFPEEVPCRVRVRLEDGRVLERQQVDYAGFHTRPATWVAVASKLDALAPEVPASARRELVHTVQEIETSTAADLAERLARLGAPAARPHPPAPPSAAATAR